MISWTEVRFSELCLRTVSGGTPLRSVDEYYLNGTIPWLKTGEVKKRVIWDTEEKITQRGLAESSAKLVPPNSVIIAMYGDGDTAGTVAINKIELTTNQACCNFIVDKAKANYRFLYYYLKANYGNLTALKLGGSQQNLNAASLKSFPIRNPGLCAQEKIAAVLSAYDDLIENNRRRIALLERMAEQLYREWFVRFRFPGYQQTKFSRGLPTDWDIGKLEQVIELGYGKALKEEDRVPGPFPVYGSSGQIGTHKTSLVDGPGIIVGRKGNVGAVHWCDFGFFPIDTAYFVKSDMSKFYLFFLLQTMNFLNNDAAVPGLNRQQAYANDVLIPSGKLIERFEKLVQPVFEQRAILSRANDQLAKTRDLLLPRLISGKLRVDKLDIQFPPSMQAESA